MEHGLYRSHSNAVTRRSQWVRNIALIQGTRNACGILVKKRLRKRALGRVRRWQDNVGMDHRETGHEDEMLTDMAHDLVQWQDLLLTALNSSILPSESLIPTSIEITLYLTFRHTLLKMQLKSTCTVSPLTVSNKIFSPCRSPSPSI